MPKDGLRGLQNHVVAPLLRALACIPRTPDSRLLLRDRTKDHRPPGHGELDYDVIFRERPIGRIWKFDYTGDTTTGPRADYLWHWYWRDMDGKKDTHGHSPTLEAAMADFRRSLGTRPRRKSLAAGSRLCEAAGGVFRGREKEARAAPVLPWKT
jgi:hypothetical protein